jgi:RNA polymerase sigma-70 factor (ECF subfamily)
VLREAFDYPYDRIALVLNSSEVSARQLVSRARKHVAREQKSEVSAQAQRTLLETFISAARSGDVDALERLLATDVVSTSDGGGVVRAARKILVGRDRVARFVAVMAEKFWMGVDVRYIEANGWPMAIVARDGVVFAALTSESSDSGIAQLYWMLNPAKLRAL